MKQPKNGASLRDEFVNYAQTDKSTALVALVRSGTSPTTRPSLLMDAFAVSKCWLYRLNEKSGV